MLNYIYKMAGFKSRKSFPCETVRNRLNLCEEKIKLARNDAKRYDMRHRMIGGGLVNGGENEYN